MNSLYDDDYVYNHIQFPIKNTQYPYVIGGRCATLLPSYGAEPISTTNIQIKKYSNHTAYRQMRKIIHRLDYDDGNNVEHFINGWWNELNTFRYDAEIICYILTDDANKTIGFCLLSLVLSNKMKHHEKSYLINYIYISTKYRQNQYGYKLLSYIQKRHETIAITMPNSFDLFEKCNYKVGELPTDGISKCIEHRATTNGLIMVYYP